MNQSYYVKLGYRFEEVVIEIFKKYNFKIIPSNENLDYGYDIEASKDNKKFAIEIKVSRNITISASQIMHSVQKLVATAKSTNHIPILVVANLIPKTLLEKLSIEKSLILIDIKKLLFLVENDKELKSKLLEVLSYSTDEIIPEKPEDFYSFATQIFENNVEIGKMLLVKISEWRSKEHSSGEYENLCVEILKYLFGDELGLWKTQEKSNDDLFRFDMICKIKDLNYKEFWKTLESYFNSKYIIFEFKNYSDCITQREIYTTEKYLYLKALRGVAIIISCNGTDKNADKAIKGILRENGKLIISLNNSDLKKFIIAKIDNDIPSDYLCEKLDDLLINLEK